MPFFFFNVCDHLEGWQDRNYMFDFPLSSLLPPFGPALLSHLVVAGKLSNTLEFITVFWLQETEALQMKDASRRGQDTVQLAPGGTSRVLNSSHFS